ncbi:NUDIX domain-containing protein [Holosporaceae bacterium 'Namur']|nr:NUDIX domain-containing protein [Holosporaceae bacterium 'Namur']
MQIDVISHLGKVLYRATREQVYEELLPHRIVLILVREGDKIFIQKRADCVKYLPGYYCTSAGGHVEAGEAPLDAAKRELKEELGLESEPEMIAEFIFDDGHYRRIFLYQITLREEMQFNDKEVAGGFFINKEELLWLPRDRLHPQLLPCVNYIWPNLL